MAGGSEWTERGLRALAEFFVDEGTLGETLLRVAELSCQVAPADMAGITMLVEGRMGTGVFTDPEAPDIDEAQYRSDSGPCLDAFRTQKIQRIDSTADDDRWPEFCEAAMAHGVRSTLSMPMTARGEGLGALNLYSRKLGAFTDEVADRVEVFSREASIVMANAQVYWDARQLSENLHQALSSRSVIDQAVGVLIANGGRSPEDAFQILVRASQRENRKLREIAEEIVDRTSRRTRGQLSD